MRHKKWSGCTHSPFLVEYLSFLVVTLHHQWHIYMRCWNFYFPLQAGMHFQCRFLRNILKFTSLYYKRSLLWAQLFLFQECACEFWGPSDKTSNCLQRSLSSMTDECVFRFKEQKFKKFSHEFFTNIRAHVFSSLIHIFTF